MVKRNNPANIRYNPANKWRGQLNPQRGFCTFSDVSFGIRALLIILFVYVRKHNLKSIKEIISRFAPPSENDTDDYISYVSNSVDVKPNVDISDKLNSDSEFVFQLCFAICMYESHYVLPRDVFNNVFFDYLKSDK